MRAIRLTRTGGPEVLDLVDIELPRPGAGEVLIEQSAIGVNFIDTYHRSGLYPISLPSGLGLEGAGIVTDVGEGVATLRAGDRVGYCTGPIGAYAQAHVAPAARVVKLPEAIAEEIAAASMLKGLTACFLLKRTFAVGPGVTCVIHAAAGGVGQIAVQWAKHMGARVIGVVGSAAKAALASSLGADHVIVMGEEPIAEQIRAITGGKGADVVYDSVGRDTFEASLDSLRPLGMLASFGNASGPPPEISPSTLAKKGSLFLTRPLLFDYARTREDLQAMADDLFHVIAAGDVRVAEPQRIALANASEAHKRLESRATAGSIVLIP